MSGDPATGSEGLPDDDAPVFPAVAEPVGDPAVDELAAKLADLPDLPIEDHNGLYAGLHDGLLAELNADPTDRPDTQ